MAYGLEENRVRAYGLEENRVRIEATLDEFTEVGSPCQGHKIQDRAAPRLVRPVRGIRFRTGQRPVWFAPSGA